MEALAGEREREIAHAVEVPERGGFRDLERDALGADALGASHSRDVGDESVVVEVEAREVDADLELGTDLLAGRREGVEGRGDDGAIDGRHDSKSLGGTQEFGWEGDASIGLAHPGERLDGHDAAASDFRHRLEVGHESGLGEGGANPVRLFAEQARVVAFAIRRVVKADAAPAAALRLMHREVCREEQVGGAARVLGEEGDARAGRERERGAPPDGRQPAYSPDDGLGARRSLGRGDSRKENGDLVAAYPASDLADQQRAAKSLRHRTEICIPREEPMRAVQGLEVVEPDDEEGERPAEEVRARDLALELKVELLPV